MASEYAPTGLYEQIYYTPVMQSKTSQCPPPLSQTFVTLRQSALMPRCTLEDILKRQKSPAGHPEAALLFFFFFRSVLSTTQETTPTCLISTAPSRADRAASEPKGGEGGMGRPTGGERGTGASLNTQLVFLRCEITSREYCDFMKGYFHEEATLCSQVSESLRL